MFSPDIDEQILDALQVIFAYELQQQVAGDPLALNTLLQDPLQNDPTTTAPFVTYSPINNEQMSMRLPTSAEELLYGSPEIGGPIKYLHFYQASFGTPQASTRQLARSQAATLMGRLISTLMKYPALAGILIPGQLLSAPDGSKVIEGNTLSLVTQAGYRIYGGETTFYSKGTVFFQYPVSWYLSTYLGAR